MTVKPTKTAGSLYYHSQCIMCENLCLNSTGVCLSCRKNYGVKNKTRVSARKLIEPDKTVKAYQREEQKQS